jgi:hypothetical protein
VTSRTRDDFLVLSKSLCVYHAQSFLVIFDFAANRQLLTYQNANPTKAYRALAYDQERSRLYAGEGNCKHGEIQVFGVRMLGANVQLELQMVLRGHKYGVSQISLVASDVLVTIGDSNDRGMLVWEIVSPRLVSANMKKAGMILGVLKVRGRENELKFLSYGT